ncbi:MAG TPA: DUF177 domain-containing protein [Dehalococcoidia bacterium]
MEYNVSSLLKEHTGATREYDVNDDIIVDGARRHVTGAVRMDRTPEGIFVRAHLSGEMPDECSRCLKRISYPIVLNIEEEYIPFVDINSGARITPPEGEEDAYRISERHILDLREAAQQYWALALPIAPVCRDDCPGLCPACGQEIGADHPCSREQIDARWQKLANLQL